MKLKYVEKIIMLCSIFLINVNAIYCQVYNIPVEFKELTEVELIKGLKNEDPNIRALTAVEIFRRLANGENKVAVGNIVEHEENYWQKKLKKIKRWTPYEQFEKEFGITEKNRKPNYENVKAYRLDHMNILYVVQNKDQTKVKKERLMYSPETFSAMIPAGFSGLWRTYHINGLVDIETSFENGKKDGVETIYYDNGMPNWTKFYKEGMLLERRRYTREGILKSKKKYNEKEREEWLRMLEYEEQYFKEEH